MIGALFSAPMVIWGTLLQRRVPPHLLGRVASLDFFVSVSLMPVSMALAGPVSEAIGLRATFLVAGIVPGVVAVRRDPVGPAAAGRDRATRWRARTVTRRLGSGPAPRARARGLRGLTRPGLG